LIRPAKRPLSAGKLRGIAAALSLVALLICVLHYIATQNQKRNRVAQTQELVKPKQEFDSLKTQGVELETERTSLADEVATLRRNILQCDRVLDSQRRRFARLLGTLARRGPEGVVVQRIDGTGDEVTVHGICLRPELANQLAVDLDDAVRPLGWHAEPPDKEALELLADGGPWKFEIELREIPEWQSGQEEEEAVTAFNP
jgi:hypothetical protein